MTYSVWQSFITDGGEQVVAAATVSVYLEASGAPATLYDGPAGSPVGSSVVSGLDGLARFFVAGGVYKIVASKGAFSKEFRHVQIGTAQGFDVGTASGEVPTVAIGNSLWDNLKKVVVESGTSRTLALIDAGKYINCTAGTAVTITIPLNATAAFPISTEIDVWQDGAGVVSFVGAVGVTIHSVGLSLAAQYRAATLKKVGTDTWHIIGALV